MTDTGFRNAFCSHLLMNPIFLRKYMQIRSLFETDLKAVANVHMLSFPKSALTKFGIEAVQRYYLWQLKGPHDSYCTGAFIEDQIVGFCFAGIFRGAESGFLTHNWRFLLLRLITHPWLLNNEIVINRIGYSRRILFRDTRKTKVQAVPQVVSQTPSIPKFAILSIATHPEYQGQGVGRQLMENAEMYARQKGFNVMRLTVHTDNHQAISFYEKLGWQKKSKNGEWKGAMEKDINKI
jgi:ribosomal protein S18 acetylase RimI-like enzyme